MASDVAWPDLQDQIAFLGETREPFLGADPSGRAPRAGLVQDAACGTGAQRRLVVDETEHGAILVTSEAMRCRFPVSLMTNKDRVATIN